MSYSMATRFGLNFSLKTFKKCGAATGVAMVTRKAYGFHFLMGTADPVAMIGIFTWPATGSIAANPVEGVEPSTASTLGSSAAFLSPAIACSRELAMSHTVSLMVYVLPQVSVNPPASL